MFAVSIGVSLLLMLSNFHLLKSSEIYIQLQQSSDIAIAPSSGIFSSRKNNSSLTVTSHRDICEL